jgi:hypothetical protein
VFALHGKSVPIVVVDLNEGWKVVLSQDVQEASFLADPNRAILSQDVVKVQPSFAVEIPQEQVVCSHTRP